MGNFVTAVIHEAAFDKLASYIEQAKKDKAAKSWSGAGMTSQRDILSNPPSS